MNRMRGMLGGGERGVLLAALALVCVCAASGAEDKAGERPRQQIGVSTSIVMGVNENDARAAFRGWAESLMSQLRTRVYYETSVRDVDSLLAAVRKAQVQIFAVSIPEFVRFAPYTDRQHIVVDADRLAGGNTYVILVRADSGIQKIQDLKGRRVILFQHATMNVAGQWLDVLLDGEGAGLPEEFFGSITRNEKLSRGVVLPVFFKQADACVVTRRGFSTMVELNPQVGKQLREVAASPPCLPSLMAFHKDYPAADRALFEQLLIDLPNGPIGKQMQTLFGYSRYMVTDMTTVTPTMEMVQKAHQIRARKGGRK